MLRAKMSERIIRCNANALTVILRQRFQPVLGGLDPGDGDMRRIAARFANDAAGDQTGLDQVVEPEQERLRLHPGPDDPGRPPRRKAADALQDDREGRRGDDKR